MRVLLRAIHSKGFAQCPTLPIRSHCILLFIYFICIARFDEMWPYDYASCISWSHTTKLLQCRLGKRRYFVWHWAMIHSKHVNILSRFLCRPELLDEINTVWKTIFQNAVRGEKEIVSFKISSIDLHGCLLRVDRCKDPNLHGLEGVLVKNGKTHLHLAMIRKRRAQDSADIERFVALRAVAKLGSCLSYETPRLDSGVDCVRVEFEGTSVWSWKT